MTEPTNWTADWTDGKKTNPTVQEQVKKNLNNTSSHYLEGICEKCEEKQFEVVWDLNKRFMDALPEYFVEGRIMTGPVSIINGQNVASMSRAFKYEYSMEYAENAKAWLTWDDFKNMVVHELATEFRREAEKKESEDLVVCPYIPVDIVRAVDPNTFQPKVTFKTRYGLMKK